MNFFHDRFKTTFFWNLKLKICQRKQFWNFKNKYAKKNAKKKFVFGGRKFTNWNFWRVKFLLIGHFFLVKEMVRWRQIVLKFEKDNPFFSILFFEVINMPRVFFCWPFLFFFYVNFYAFSRKLHKSQFYLIKNYKLTGLKCLTEKFGDRFKKKMCLRIKIKR